MTDTTKKVIVLLSITAVAAGGYAAYKLYQKKQSEKTEELISGEIVEFPKEKTEKTDTAEQPEKFIFGDQIAAMPEPTEVERTAYEEISSGYRKKTEDKEEVSEENIAASKEIDDYISKNKNKIIVLPEDQIYDTWGRDEGNDPEAPGVVYEEEELYYFTEDDRLTDEDGNDIDEERYLGKKPRQFGWFTNDKDDIFIRNNPLERDFRVNKAHASKEDYFPEY